MTLESRHRFLVPSPLKESLSNQDLKFIQSHCCRKLKFRLKSEAIRKVISFLDHFEEQEACTIYHCKFCGGWHFSTHETIGFTDEMVKEKVEGIHGKRRANMMMRMRQKNRTIRRLTAANLLSPDSTLVVWCPPKI